MAKRLRAVVNPLAVTEPRLAARVRQFDAEQMQAVCAYILERTRLVTCRRRHKAKRGSADPFGDQSLGMSLNQVLDGERVRGLRHEMVESRIQRKTLGHLVRVRRHANEQRVTRK